MTRWQLLDTAKTDGGLELKLYERQGELSIRMDGRELMTSAAHASEECLAELALTNRQFSDIPRVLVGGLGLGYTLRAARSLLPADSEIVVAEVMAPVIAWHKPPDGPLSGDLLSDPRVTTLEADVRQCLDDTQVWDAILLDVDNGPGELSRPANAWLYSTQGLTTLHDALRPTGKLTIWSADDEPGFSARMQRCGFEASHHEVSARRVKNDPKHSIWLGTRLY